MELFGKLVIGWKVLIISAKSFILDAWQLWYLHTSLNISQCIFFQENFIYQSKNTETSFREKFKKKRSLYFPEPKNFFLKYKWNAKVDKISVIREFSDAFLKAERFRIRIVLFKESWYIFCVIKCYAFKFKLECVNWSICARNLFPLFCLHQHKFPRYVTSCLWLSLWRKHVLTNQNLKM